MNATIATPLHPPPAVLSLRNYRHLAAHHGHDLTVAIYGGDASVALECETCHSILIAFENTPSQEASLTALLALTQRLHIEPKHLASHLSDAANQQAIAVNKQGLHAQLTYLLTTLGATATHELIAHLATETRRG